MDGWRFLCNQIAVAEAISKLRVFLFKTLDCRHCMMKMLGKISGQLPSLLQLTPPLLPNQLRILAKHATHGIARTGALSGTLSGDFAIAFSTANPGLHERLRTASETDDPVVGEPGVYNEMLHVLSDQVVFATEEAIINALIASDTMEGFGHVAYKLPLKVIAKSFSEHRLPRINI